MRRLSAVRYDAQALRRSVVVLCALLCSSCSTKTSDLLRRTEPPDVTRLIHRVAEGNSHVRSLSGNGSVSFESPDLGGSVYFRVALKKPDSVLIRFEGPFGMDVGFLFLSPNRYVMYNSIENQVTTGIPTSGNIRSLIPFDLTYEQIVNAFAGAFPLPPIRQFPIRLCGMDHPMCSPTVGAPTHVSTGSMVPPTRLPVTRSQTPQE